MIDQAVEELALLVGVTAACRAVGRSRGSHYRWHRKSPPPPKPERVATPQPRALSAIERKEVLRVLHDPEHVDEAPATVYARLLDAGVYLASTSTMYRLLRAEGEVTERRRQATHPPKVKPELLATGQRRVVLGHHQAARPGQMDLVLPVRDLGHLQPLCARLDAGPGRAGPPGRATLADTIANQHVTPDQLTIHADRGTAMASKPVAFLLADLGVTKSHSRPHCCSNHYP